MPFDGLPDTPVTDRIIDRALELLGPNGERWIQGAGVMGGRRCLGNAIKTAAREIDAKYEFFITRVLSERVGNIPHYNDIPGRSFAEIKQLLEFARTLIKEKVPA